MWDDGLVVGLGVMDCRWDGMGCGGLEEADQCCARIYVPRKRVVGLVKHMIELVDVPDVPLGWKRMWKLLLDHDVWDECVTHTHNTYVPSRSLL